MKPILDYESASESRRGKAGRLARMIAAGFCLSVSYWWIQLWSFEFGIERHLTADLLHGCTAIAPIVLAATLSALECFYFEKRENGKENILSVLMLVVSVAGIMAGTAIWLVREFG